MLPGMFTFEIKLAKTDAAASGPHQITVTIPARGQSQAIAMAENQNRGYKYFSSRQLNG